MASQLPVLVLLPLFAGCLLVPALGLWKRRLTVPVTLVCLLAYVVLAFRMAAEVARVDRIRYALAGWEPPIGIELCVDRLNAFVIVVIACIALLVAVYASRAVRAEHPAKEVPFFGMVFVLLLGLTGMAVTADLFNLYVFFELVSLGSYALVALGDRKAAISAFRYLIQGTLGASLYLIGVGFLYVLTGSLNMADVAERLVVHQGSPAYQVALVLLVAGLGLKMALFPMHLWLPDAYTHASSTATAIIAPVVTKLSAYVLIRVLYQVFDPAIALGELGVGQILTWLSAVGIVVASVMAIAQNSIKRMLAFSSVAQVAYIGLGIGLGSPIALIGAVLHVLNHAVMKCCLFLVAGGVALRTGTTRVRGLAGLGRRMPWTFAAFTLAALAMVGIPPTSGFFSKWYLLLGILERREWVLAALFVGSSLLTAVYFFRVLELVWARPPSDAPTRPAADLGPGEGLPLVMALPLVILGLATLALGLGNSWIVDGVLRHALPLGSELPPF